MFILVFHVAPTGAPRDVTSSITSRSIVVTWGEIDCIERNGMLTGYTMIFREQGGDIVHGDFNTTSRTFSATELTPFTNYTFRIAGVGFDGVGVYAELTITTDEDGLLKCENNSILIIFPHSSWSCVRPHCSSRSYFCSAHLECPSRT